MLHKILAVCLAFATVFAAAQTTPDREKEPSEAYRKLLELVKPQLRSREWSAALPLVERMLQIARSDGSVSEAALAHQFRGTCFLGLGRFLPAADEFRDAAEGLKALGDSVLRLDPLGFQALCLSLAEDPRATQVLATLIEEALAQRERSHGAFVRLRDLVPLFSQRGAHEKAIALGNGLVRITEAAAPARRDDRPEALFSLGTAELQAGRLDEAERHLRMLLQPPRTSRTETLRAGESQLNLGVIALTRGELAAAENALQDAAAIGREFRASSALLAQSLTNLGVLEQMRGALGRSQELHEQAHQALETLSARPSGPVRGPSEDDRGAVAVLIRTNRAVLRQSQGDLAGARRAYLEILALPGDRRPPGAEGIALMNLGVLALQQGDATRGREYFNRALKLQESLAPRSQAVATTLSNLAATAIALGDPTTAAGYLERSAALWQSVAPESGGATQALSGLAVLAVDRGDREAALRHWDAALDIVRRRKLGPSFAVPILLGAATLRLNSGDRGGSRAVLEQAGAALGPGRWDAPAAATLADLRSRLAEAEGKPAEAERFATEAVRMVDRAADTAPGGKRGRELGELQTRAAGHLVRSRLVLGRLPEAWLAAEQARRRPFRRLLGERDPLMQAVYGPLAERRRKAVAEASLAAQRLHRATRALESSREAAREAPATAESREALRRRADAADRLRAEYLAAQETVDALEAEFQRQTPHLADIPPSLSGIRSGTPPRALALEYVAGPEETDLFLIPAAGEGAVTVQRVPVGRAELSRRVRAFRGAAASPRSDQGQLGRAGTQAAEVALPPAVRARVAAARLLILAPDGPLWELPFAALPAPGSARGRLLGEERALQYVESLAAVLERAPKSGAPVV